MSETTTDNPTAPEATGAGPEQTTPPANPQAPQDPAPPATPEQPTEPTTPEPTQEPASVEELPQWAQKMIGDLRKENGDERVASKTLDAIQKALNPEAPKDEKPTPEALAAQVTEHQQAAEAAQKAQRDAQVHLAVVLAALDEGADHKALLDSRSFLAKLDGLDPSDGEKITAAIKEAVQQNPKLKTSQVAGRSGTELPGGSGTPPQKAGSLSEALAQHYANN